MTTHKTALETLQDKVKDLEEEKIADYLTFIQSLPEPQYEPVSATFDQISADIFEPVLEKYGHPSDMNWLAENHPDELRHLTIQAIDKARSHGMRPGGVEKLQTKIVSKDGVKQVTIDFPFGKKRHNA